MSVLCRNRLNRWTVAAAVVVCTPVACSEESDPTSPTPGIEDSGVVDVYALPDAAIDAAVDHAISAEAGHADVSAPLEAGLIDRLMPPADALGEAAADTGSGPDGSSPKLLAETGLYEESTLEVLAPGVRAYRPRFELWSDGATKRRWILLPPDSTIDTSDPDGWVFPVGTKLWKEFTRDGVRVETRLIEKTGPGVEAWEHVAFAWNQEQTRAHAVPRGETDWLGTPHDIPSRFDCFGCHGGSADFVLGFSQLQLAHDTTGLSVDEIEQLGMTLADAEEAGWLAPSPAGTAYPLPGDETAQAALGVLHANCGHCHQPGPSTAWERADLELRLRVDALQTVAATPAYQSALGVETARLVDAGTLLRIDPGQPGASAVYRRMTSRDDTLAMPPLATELVDQTGAMAVFEWIENL